MNSLLKDIIMILSGIIGGCIFFYIKNKITNKMKTKIRETLPEVKEAFSLNKFTKGLLNVSNPVMWSKDIASIFSLRKLIIIGAIIGVIYGYGYFKGVQNKPVVFDMRGKEAIIKLNEHYLKIEKNGTAKVVDKDGKILKTIKVSDIPSLARALRPYGFELSPIAVVGAGIGESGAGIEGGAGVSFFKWYMNNLDAFLTNRGAYLGVSYRLENFKLNNTSIGIGIGKGYKQGDNRVILYGRIKF